MISKPASLEASSEQGRIRRPGMEVVHQIHQVHRATRAPSAANAPTFKFATQVEPGFFQRNVDPGDAIPMGRLIAARVSRRRPR